MVVTDHGPGSPQPEGHGDNLKTLKYHLLGPSLTKAGQDAVDQAKVSFITFLPCPLPVRVPTRV